MHGKSSFQGKVRVIAISLGIILIVGGCSSSHTGKENTQEAALIVVMTWPTSSDSAQLILQLWWTWPLFMRMAQ